MSVYETLRKLHDTPDFDGCGVDQEAIKSFCEGMGRFVMAGSNGMWMPPESKDGHCDPESLAIALAGRMSALCDVYNAEGVGSPIEAMLLGALLWIDLPEIGLPVADFFGGPSENLEVFGEHEHGRYVLTTQAPIAGYKADFLLWIGSGLDAFGVVVECDGHEFHEKTKEQAARDKRRDREILTAGFPVLRFTGSEVFRDPWSCAKQVQQAMEGPWRSAMQVMGRAP